LFAVQFYSIKLRDFRAPTFKFYKSFWYLKMDDNP